MLLSLQDQRTPSPTVIPTEGRERCRTAAQWSDGRTEEPRPTGFESRAHRRRCHTAAAGDRCPEVGLAGDRTVACDDSHRARRGETSHRLLVHDIEHSTQD